MKVLFDTSVAVPSLWPWHPHHAAAFAWLQAVIARRVHLVIATHTLAETYSVSTRLPAKFRVPPMDAWQAIERSLIAHSDLIDITAALYKQTLSSLALANRGGGLIYDALIIAAAESAQVDFLLTNNLSHFRSLWPAGHNRVTSPDLLAPP